MIDIVSKAIDFGEAIQNQPELADQLDTLFPEEDYLLLRKVCKERGWDVNGMVCIAMFQLYQQTLTPITNSNECTENSL